MQTFVFENEIDWSTGDQHFVKLNINHTSGRQKHVTGPSSSAADRNRPPAEIRIGIRQDRVRKQFAEVLRRSLDFEAGLQTEIQQG